MSSSPQRLTAREADIGGGLKVHRLIPSRQRRLIGAWCFLDHAGPAVFETGGGMRVGPHPHIGLQTFTWMLEGEVLHRDSLGNEQVIRPGQVNLMTAGHGISHTEESLPDQERLHAAQLWIALPYDDRNVAPAFDHYPDLPQWADQGATFTLLAGEMNGERAPARIYSDLLGVDVACTEQVTVTVPLRPDWEYGFLPLQGGVEIDAETFGPNELAFLAPGTDRITVTLAPGSRILLVGGAPFGQEIVMWWNFVGHSKQEVADAQREWEAASPRFGTVNGFDGPRLVAPPLAWR
jgi:redox-sensitive bicupin YhaK (pirin superfamily)